MLACDHKARHHEIWKYYQSSSKTHAEALENPIVRERMGLPLALLLAAAQSWQRSDWLRSLGQQLLRPQPWLESVGRSLQWICWFPASPLHWTGPGGLPADQVYR